MKKSFAVIALAAGIMGFSGLASAQFTAIAAGTGGVACAQGRTMEQARENAVNQCRRMGGSCGASTAERSDWNFVGGYCDGEPYTAAHPDGEAAAYLHMLKKAGTDDRNRCRLVKSC